MSDVPKCVSCLKDSPQFKLCDDCYKLFVLQPRERERGNGHKRRSTDKEEL